jgi:hypothetical protein
MTDISDDSLPTCVNVHVLDRYVLLAFASFSHKRFHLLRVGAQEFVRQAAEHVQPSNPIAYVQMPRDGTSSAGNQFK